MQVLKQKKFEKLVISCDGGAASGKTTGAKLISKNLKTSKNFLRLNKKQNLKGATIIVISSSIKKNNPQLLEAKKKKLISN